MIFELIIRYIEENWTWIIAGFATAFVAITILTRKRKASKSCTGIKGEEEQSKTILKGRKLAVFFNGRFTISGYAASIIGTRKDQQDSYAVVALDEGKNGKGGLLGIVCDGMGGLAAGKKASDIGVTTFLEYFQKAHDSAESYDACARAAIDKADQKVVEISHELGEGCRAGTTLVSAYVTCDKLYWCSVGDSRIFHYRYGKLHQLTRDHNYSLLLQEQVRKGTLIKEKAEADPEKDALISFIGIDGVPLADTEKKGIGLQAGDVVVLCSDGLYKALPEAEIQEIIRRYEDKPEFLPGVLTASALDKWHRHQDNTTVVVLSCQYDGGKKNIEKGE